MPFTTHKIKGKDIVLLVNLMNKEFEEKKGTRILVRNKPTYLYNVIGNLYEFMID